MKKTLLTVVCASLLTCSVAQADPASSEKQAKNAIQFRQALLQVIRSNVGALGGMAKGAIPYDVEVMEKNAMRIEQLSLMMSDYFKTDTSGFDIKSDALPKIWQNNADFEQKIVDLTNAAGVLKVTAGAKDEDNYKSAIGGVLKSCKGCHDEYKAD